MNDLQKLIIVYPDKPWDGSSLTQNPNITPQFMMEHTQIKWHGIELNPNTTREDLLQLFQDLSRSRVNKYDILTDGASKADRLEDIAKHPALQWSDVVNILEWITSKAKIRRIISQISDKEYITFDVIKSHPEYYHLWDWYLLSRNLAISLHDILRTLPCYKGYGDEILGWYRFNEKVEEDNSKKPKDVNGDIIGMSFPWRLDVVCARADVTLKLFKELFNGYQNVFYKFAYTLFNTHASFEKLLYLHKSDKYSVDSINTRKDLTVAEHLELNKYLKYETRDCLDEKNTIVWEGSNLIVLSNPRLSFDYILSGQERIKPRKYEIIGASLQERLVIEKMHILKKWKYISENPGLNYDNISQNLNYDWDWKALSANRFDWINGVPRSQYEQELKTVQILKSLDYKLPKDLIKIILDYSFWHQLKPID